MKIDEAIGILEFQGAPEEGPTIHDFIKAKELGIEALKFIKLLRGNGSITSEILLSGETKE